MQPQIEPIVDGVGRSAAIYTGVVGFKVTRRTEDGFTEFVQGSAALVLSRRSILGLAYLIYTQTEKPLGRGIKIVLYVENI